MLRGTFAFVAAACIAIGPATATDRYDPFTRPYDQPDLQFAAEPKSVDKFGINVVYKPEGAGPFPGLVVMPTCGGIVAALWKDSAVKHGYAVIIVDPVLSRKVSTNCEGSPLPIGFGRLLKDAFDAADHLRSEPFVDPERIGLMGFSQGAMVGLAAAGSTYHQLAGRKPFGAVVIDYPVCVFKNEKHPLEDRIVDIWFVPDKFVVPALLQVGSFDQESGEPMNGCKEPFDQHVAAGEPIEFKIYEAGHVWDLRGNREVTEQAGIDAFAFLDAHLKP